MRSCWESLCTTIGHDFHDEGLLRLALTHSSAGKTDNERLEFLGDAVLGFIISQVLFERFPDAVEGELSRYRAGLVQKATLAEVARELGLGDYLILGAGEMKSGGADRDSILADALEALISALYLDAGLAVCREKVVQWFASRLENLRLEPAKDAKTRLQEYMQARQLPLPRYEVLEVSGKDHSQVFSVNCEVVLLSEAVRGVGGTRREAEQHAAAQALQALGE